MTTYTVTTEACDLAALVLPALELAQQALKISAPTQAHYPEPVARHAEALAAVQAALATIALTTSSMREELC